MKWLKRILIVLMLLLAIVAALPFFISLDNYLPQIEKAASEKLKEPVTIKSIRFAALPLPHVTLDGITIGANDIKLGKLQVTPDVFSLLQPTKVIRSIDADSLVLTQKAINNLPAWFKPDAAQTPAQPLVRVEGIRLNNVQVNFGKTGFGPFNVRAGFDNEGSPKNASVDTLDGKLKAAIRIDQSKYFIDASAKSWTLPVGPALVFDELAIKGVATASDANLSQVNAKLYGGTATGKAAINWRKGMQLNGNLNISHLELQSIAAMLSHGTNISGKLNAKPAFSAAAASADQLGNALRLETLFDIENGVVHGVDIEKAATNRSKQGTTGGETRFEQLSGHLLMDRGSYSFTQLQITSGNLAVDGNVNISPKKELSGQVSAKINALGAVPLNVSGTVDAPVLYPTGGTMAGAAVGTVILGPGLGTSVGAKVGGWVENLFGKKEKAKK